MLSFLEEAPALVQAVIFAQGAAVAKFADAILKLPVAEPVIFYASESQSLPPNHPAHGTRATKDTLYLCRGTTCSLPVTSPDEVPAAWASIS